MLMALLMASKSVFDADHGLKFGGGLVKSIEETVLNTLSQSHLSNISWVIIGGFVLISDGLKPVNGCELLWSSDLNGCLDGGPVCLDGLPNFGLSSTGASLLNFTGFKSLQCLSSDLMDPSAYVPTWILTVDLDNL